MSLSDAARNSVLKLLFQGVNWANMADNAASAPLAQLYVSLHTADPGSGGNQSTSEIVYTGYARIPVVRSAAGWTVVGNVVQNAATITFGLMTSGAGGTVTHAAVGFSLSGAGAIICSGPISPNRVIVPTVTPALTPSTITLT